MMIASKWFYWSFVNRPGIYRKYGGYFNSEAPKYVRDITNSEQAEALDVEKRNRKDKQEQYARELALQLEELTIKKANEKSQRRSSVTPVDQKDQRETADKTKKLQNQRDYADSLQEHINLQNMLKQQQKEKEQYENQFLTGLDIKGAYKYNGPTQEEMREQLTQQIQRKEYLKQREYENRAAYEEDEQPDYDPYQNIVFKKPVNVDAPTGGEKLDIFGNLAFVAGKGSNAKENVSVDIFGNPSRQPTQKSSKPLNYDLDIFGNPARSKHFDYMTWFLTFLLLLGR